MMLFWLFPLLLLVFVPLMIVRYATGAGCGMHGYGYGPGVPAPHAPAGKDPVEIVRERLARGEITAAEYEEIRKALG